MARLLAIVFTALFTFSAIAQDKICSEALVASGRSWESTHLSPRSAIHPGYSKSAETIYFMYDIPGLEIFIEQGPYGGSHTRGNEIKTLFIQYNPELFLPTSYFRLIFGSKPLSIHLKDEDFRAHYETASLDADQILEIRIPIEQGAETWDLSKSIQLIISRDTGRVYGYGPKSRSKIRSFAKDIWLELRGNSNAAKSGYGTWYNSNSGMPIPVFYKWAMERANREKE